MREREGKLLLNRGYGFADWEAGARMSPATVFDIGSVSKQFTAAAILKLEEMGRLRVEDPISRFLPDTPAGKRAITLHQLLTHTSGLPLEVVAAERAGPRDATIAAILRAKLAFAPGEKWLYSNAGYAVLAAVVEIASGEPYEAFLRRNLWAPAGMRHTGWRLVDRRGEVAAKGYTATRAMPDPPLDSWIESGPLWSRRGAGAILSTSDDLRLWARALRRGALLSEGSIAKLLRPHVRETPGENSFYAYGWTVSAAPDGSCKIAHNGSNSLHYNVLRIYPERDLITYAATNQDRSPLRQTVVGRAEGVLLGGRESALPATKRPTPAAARALAGRWRAEDGTELELVAVGSRLLAPTWRSGVVRLFTAFKPLSAEDEGRITATRRQIPAVIDALYRGDYTPLLAIKAREVDEAEERRYWPNQWARWVGAHGAYRGTELVATTRRGEWLVTYAMVKFERFNVPVSVAYDAQGGISVGNNIGADEADEFIPPEYVLAPQGGGRFVVHNPTHGSVDVRMDSDGKRLRISCPRGITVLARAARTRV